MCADPVRGLNITIHRRGKKFQVLNRTDIQSGSTCMLCGSRSSTHQFPIDDVHVVRCNNCSLVYSIDPNPGTLPNMSAYDANYFFSDHYKGGYQDYKAEAATHEATFEHRLMDAQRRFGNVGILLDVGCAFGHLGNVARRLGWQVFGTDISLYAARQAQLKGQLIFVSDVSQPCIRDGHFDLICLYDLIEHLPDPVTMLQRLCSLLRPGGMIHISTPDVESLSARLMGRQWYHYKPHEHVCYFSPQTLHRVLAQAGFEVLHIGPLPSYMAVEDILVRLRFYSRLVADTLLYCLKWLGLHRKVIKIYVGEMEAWARAP